jgi:hypothetical protein
MNALESSQQPMQPVHLEPKLSQLFLEWFRIGATSFGGGVGGHRARLDRLNQRMLEF